MSKRKDPVVIDYVAKVKPLPDGPGGDKCSELSFTSGLQDIQQPALSKLVKGNVYEVKLDSNVPKVYNDEGEICGTVISLRITELMSCLQNGKLFSAKILELNGDLCTVAIKAS